MLFFVSPALQPISYNAAAAPWFTTPVFLLVAFSAFLLAKKSSLNTNRHILFLLGLSLIPLLFKVDSAAPGNLLFYLAFIFTMVIAWIWGSNISGNQTLLLYKTFIFGAFIWCILALIVWLGLTDGKFLRIGDWLLSTHIQSKINGPFANGNVFGILTFCAATASLWLWVRCKDEQTIFWYTLLLFFWSVGISSMSRGAWIAHTCVLFIAVIQIWNVSKKKLLLIAVAIFLAVGFANLIHSNNAYRGKSFQFSEQYSNTVEGGVGSRILIWAAAYEMWTHNKLSGAGYGAFSSQFLTSQSAALNDFNFSYTGFDYVSSAHNIFLHLMAEAGLAGLILAILVSFFVTFALFKNWNRFHSYAWPATMIAFMLWLQGMANITMNRPFPILLFTLALAISLAPTLRNKMHLPILKKSLYIPLILSLIIFTVVGSEQVKGWWDYEEWLITADNTERKRELSASLLADQNLMPYMVSVTMQKVISDPARHAYAPKLIPFIHQALALQEHKILYQGLFFGQVLSNDLENACKTGMFMESQNWADNKNHEFHIAACEGRLDSDFHITPEETSEPSHPTHL